MVGYIGCYQYNILCLQWNTVWYVYPKQKAKKSLRSR